MGLDGQTSSLNRDFSATKKGLSVRHGRCGQSGRQPFYAEKPGETKWVDEDDEGYLAHLLNALLEVDEG